MTDDRPSIQSQGDMSESNDFELRIAKLVLGREDVLVVRVDRIVPTETLHRVGQYVRRTIGDDDTKILVIDSLCDLSVITRADIEARAIPLASARPPDKT